MILRTLCLASLLLAVPPALATKAATRPNILLIVADDLGYSDLGAFGGEIHTPNLDLLAAEGRLLTQFHTAATCSPTRAALISGADHHPVGLATMAGMQQDNQRGQPGYEGYLNERALSIAQLLKDGGYHTYIAGKWHLGETDAQSPTARGFERAFTLLGGAGSHFAPVPGKEHDYDQVKYREDGRLTTIPPHFYSTDFYTDKLLSYFKADVADGKPFFAFAAYTTPHWPLQAPAEYLERYRGRYDAGYAAVRAARVARQRALGLIPAGVEPAPRLPATPDNPDWEALMPETRASEARKMEVYAAMVENLDANVGRLIRALKQDGRYDNTLIVFFADNGAEGARGHKDGPNIDNSLANYGKPLSNLYYGKRWAEVSATPHRLWKGHATQGGVNTPAIVRLPGQQTGKPLFGQLATVRDIAPTLLQLARLPNPGKRYADKAVEPLSGVSLLSALQRDDIKVRPEGAIVADELFGRRYVRQDQWKLVWEEAPWGASRWALYDLATDPAEQHDLAFEHPARVERLTAGWNDYARRNGVILPARPGMAGRE